MFTASLPSYISLIFQQCVKSMDLSQGISFLNKHIYLFYQTASEL